MVPSFSRKAQAAARELAAFALTIDNVRIVIVKPPNDTVADTTVAVGPQDTVLVLDIPVHGAQAGDLVDAGIQFRDGNQVLFEGSSPVSVTAPGAGGTPTGIININFVGPGADAVALRITPRDTIIRDSDSLAFHYAATKSTGDTIPNAIVAWQSSNTQLATIDGSGTLRTTGNRGSIMVIAHTLSGVRDSTTVTITGTPAKLAVSTAPPANVQDRKAFTIAPVIQVQDAQGTAVGLAGIAVKVAISSGGGVLAGDTAVTTDANGRATFTTLSITGTAGARTLGFTSGALTATSATVTVVGGDAVHIASHSGDGQSATAGSAVATAPSVLVTDADGNAVPAIAVTFAVASGGGSGTGLSTATNGAGIAAVGSWTLGKTAGSNTLTATSNGLTGSPVTFTATGTPGTASSTTSTITPRVSSVTAGDTVTVTVQLKDSFGNALGSGGATVALSTSIGTLSAVADQHNGTYTAILSTSTAGTATITGKVGGVSMTQSTAVTVNVGAISAAQTVATVPSGTAGSPTTILVQAKDAQGNDLTTGGSLTRFAFMLIGGNSGAINTLTMADNNNGTYTFKYTPTYADTDKIGITIDGLSIKGSPYPSVVSAGALNSFVVEATGGGAIAAQTAGASFDIRITAHDANGNTVSSFTSAVQLTSTGALSGAPVTTAAFSSGVLASQAVTITNTGSFTLTATGGGKAGTSAAFTVNSAAASASQSTIVATSPVTAGGTSTVTVQARDAFGNSLTSGGATVVLATTLGTLSAVTDHSNGTYSAMLTTSATGTATISATLNGTSLPLTASVVINPGAANATTTTITSTVDSLTANGTSSTTITVQAKDAHGNALTTSGGTVTLNTSLGTLSSVVDHNNGTYTATLTSSTSVGSATVSGTIAGQTISSSAHVAFVPGTSTAANSTITLSPPSPATVTVGTPVSVLVQLKDAKNNNITTGGATVVIAKTGVGAMSATTDNGNGTYSATLTSTQSGGATIGATVNGSTITGSGSPSVTYTPGAATQLGIATQPSATATAGAPFAQQPVIEIRDANGNVVTSDNSTLVTASVNSGSDVLHGTLTETAVQGVATFTDLSYNLQESITLKFTASGLTTATSSVVAVSPGAETKLTLTTAPSATAQDSVPFATQPVVQLRDAFNNAVHTPGVSVVASITSGSGTLAGTTTVATDANGTATFTNLEIRGSTGSYALQFASGVLTAASANVTLGAGALNHFVVEAAGGGPIPQQTAGTSFAIRLTAADVDGNTVSGFGGTVQLTSTGTLSGAPLTTASFTSGVLASQSVTITNTGTFTITANDGASHTGASNSFGVVPGSGTYLVVSTQPSATATAGVDFAQQPVVEVVDANLNLVTSDNSTLVTATDSGTGSLQGTASIKVTNGVATFTNLSYNVAQTIRLRFNASGFTQVSSNTIAVGPTALAQFAISDNAGNPIGPQTAGTPFTVKVVAQDVYHNTVSSFTGTVNVSSANSTMSAGAGASPAFTAGVLANYSVTLTGAGLGKTISVNDGSGHTGTSNAFDVAAAAASQLALTTLPSDSVNDRIQFPTQPVVQVEDQYGNPVSQAGVSVSAALSPPSDVTTIGVTLSVNTDANGQAQFTDLTLSGRAGPYGIAFSAPSTALTGVTGNVTLYAGAPASIQLVSGDAQTVVAGTTLAVNPTVLVQDADGNAVPGDSVEFLVTGGGGTIAGGAPISATTTHIATDPTGMASVASWTLGTAGGTNHDQLTARLIASCPLVECAPPPSVGFSETGVWPTKSLSTGKTHTCGLTANGTAYCWGVNAHYALGGTSLDPSLTYAQPQPVAGGYTFASIAVGDDHTCGIVMGSGLAYCWGSDALGQLGIRADSGKDVPTPSPVDSSSTLAFTTIVAGANHTCAVQSGNTTQPLWCWGDNAHGQTGDDFSSPTMELSPYNSFFYGAVTNVTAGGNVTCAIVENVSVTTTDYADCVGQNNQAQLADSSGLDQGWPVQVTQTDEFLQIATGGNHTCAVRKSDNNTFCWGLNDKGQLGNPSVTDLNRSTPAQVDASSPLFTGLALGGSHSCGLTSAGTLYCWGRNVYGQLGNGKGDGTDTYNSATPVAVIGGLTFNQATITASGDRSCGVDASLTGAYCWGYGADGGIGNNSTNVVWPFPAVVVTPPGYTPPTPPSLCCGVRSKTTPTLVPRRPTIHTQTKPAVPQHPTGRPQATIRPLPSSTPQPSNLRPQSSRAQPPAPKKLQTQQ